MPTEGERIQALGDFLREAFALRQLEQFLVTKGYADVADAVHTEVSLDQYAFAVVQELTRRGLIDAAFFERLEQERPARAAEIRRLEGAWLGAGKAGAPPSGRTTRPCNLPLVSIGTLFKGRAAFLDDLRQRLTARGVRAMAVHGLGGVGKTRAAVEYAWRHAEDYTALLFVSAPTPAELHANLANLVGVLGIPAETTAVAQHLAAVLDWLEGHPGWLLILDNVDTEEAAAEVQRLLPRLRAGHVLITARIAHWGAGVQRLDLDVLAPEAAVAFLLERAPLRRPAPDDASRAAAIARELDGLALALEQAGAYIDKLGLSFAEYLKHWEAKRPEVLSWHNQRLMGYPASVAATWETTLARLEEPERHLLEVLAWLAPAPIPLVLFEADPLAAALPEPREALAGLEGYSLARFDASGDAVLVHRLVQEITRDRIPVADRTARLQLALGAVNALAVGNPGDVRTWGLWTPLAAHVEAVSRCADEAGLAEPTARLMNNLGVYRQARGQYRAAEPLYRRALAIDEQSRGPDHPEVAIRLNNLAVLLRATDRLAEAEPLYRRALAIRERGYGPDHPTVAQSLNNLAVLLKATNRLGEAEPLFRRALAIDEHSYGPDHPNVATDLNNLAELLRATDRSGEAEPLYRRALAIDERSYGPDHPNVAESLNNLAGLLGDTHRPDEAESLSRRAARILIEFRRRTGYEPPNFRRFLGHYRVLLKALGKTPEQIEQQVHELVESPGPEGS
jgi:tetratricopeptide (TPR) repeat protein